MAKANKLITDESPKEAKETVSKAPRSSKGISSKISISNKNKLRNIFGALFLLFAVYFFLSCLSYFFSWKADQDRVMDKGFWEFILDNNPVPVENWLGKFGAWISHVFIYCWFGVASILFSFVFLVIGSKLLLRYQILSFKKLAAFSVLSLVWFSLFLSYFSPNISVLGGTFGYELNQWLNIAIGRFGALLFILIVGFVSVVILFNPDFQAIFNKFRQNNLDEEVEEDDLEDTLTEDDLYIKNTLTEKDIIPENISDSIDFSEEDNDSLEDEELDEELTIVSNGEEDNGSEIEDDEEFSVEIAQTENELSENELNKKLSEFGEYDPTLDLSSYTLPPIDLLVDYGAGKQPINIDKVELENNKNKIVETLANYNIEIAKIKATVGPTVTLYEIIPAPGVRISKIKNLEDDIALS
jgi:S-DNA-T family DNA segregation ATPase FtsK/SpoIIIE